MELMSLGAFALAVAITFFGGFVKGVVGFALPLIMISGLSTFLDPQLALAGIILPIVAANVTQTLRAGIRPAIAAARQFWRYLIVVCVMILLAAQLVTSLSPQLFSLILGVPVVVLSLIQLAGMTFHIAQRHRWWTEWVAGIISGTMGGLTGNWGSTTVLYLLATDVPRGQQGVVQGVIYGLGSLMLLVAHLKSGILNGETAPFSAALLIPSLLGMWIGFAVQDRLPAAVFKRAILVVLLVAGANLIRKGLM
ncbi:MAG: sulfite exporter TauE/SafE family protein [Planktotalea arctica]